ncbi:MAG: metal ABC transporter ATP-binding protein [Actinomycetia bacterium]|nr:metal ABC transporter ATP-binding protein [Actinomycetes bacterium]
MTDLLELRNVSVFYGARAALDSVTFSVPHGGQVAVVGPNGAGKSTLFKAMVGLAPLRSGEILIHGRPPGEYRDPIAYVPQREEVDWRFPVTVFDVVGMGRYRRGRWLKRLSAIDRAVVHRSLDLMGIADLAERPIGELSGGQQQRVFLARALAQEPHVLLLDEPFTGVDIATREATLELLGGLKARAVTALVSTHDLDLASGRFEQVVLLNRRLISAGRPAEVFTEQHLQAAFGGQMVVVNGRAIVVDQCCGGHGPVGGVDACHCDTCEPADAVGGPER